MKNIINILFALFAVIGNTQLLAKKTSEASRWKPVFDKYQVKGTFVLKNLKTGETSVYDKARTQTRFCPASTFKIPNSLISLECGSVKNIHDTIRWDGQDRGLADWNKDQDMQSAIRVSCVWFYRELARRTGKARMEEWIHKIGYGNQSIGNEADYFWLNDALKISALEQVSFIQKLVNKQLPFRKNIQETVKQMILTDSTESYKLYSKTGWTMRNKPGIGWLVGWVENKNGTYIFALNIDIHNENETALRKQISYEILRKEGVIN